MGLEYRQNCPLESIWSAMTYPVHFNAVRPTPPESFGCPRCSTPRLRVVEGQDDAGKRLARAIQEAVDAAARRREEQTPDTVRWLAPLVSVSTKTVSRWMNGEAVPDALQLRPLADALGVSPMLFVDPPPVPEYPLAEYLVRQATQEGQEEGLRRARGPRQQREAS